MSGTSKGVNTHSYQRISVLMHEFLKHSTDIRGSASLIMGAVECLPSVFREAIGYEVFVKYQNVFLRF